MCQASKEERYETEAARKQDEEHGSKPHEHGQFLPGGRPGRGPRRSRCVACQQTEDADPMRHVIHSRLACRSSPITDRLRLSMQEDGEGKRCGKSHEDIKIP